MPLHLIPSPSGDGAGGLPPAGPVPSTEEPPKLVVVEHVLASEIPRGPRLPLYLVRVRAGFPSPADDYVEKELNLHELVGADAPSCYFMRVEGESMTGDGIFDGDMLVVDKAPEPVNGDIVVASVDGELTVKRFMRRGKRVALLAAHASFKPIEMQDGQTLVIWGVVTHILRNVRRPWAR